MRGAILLCKYFICSALSKKYRAVKTQFSNNRLGALCPFLPSTNCEESFNERQHVSVSYMFARMSRLW